MGKTEVECCDVTCIHNENVKLALEQMPDEELLNSLADFYKAFADGTRVKILKNRRDGKTVYYSLADGHIQSIISQGMEHITE